VRVDPRGATRVMAMKPTFREFICIATLGMFAFGVNSSTEIERKLVQLYDSLFNVKYPR